MPSKNKKSTKKSSNARGLAVAGAAALAVAAASAYLLSSKTQRMKLKKNLGSAKKHVKHLSGQISSELKKAKTANKKAFHQAVSKSVAQYKKLKNLNPQEATVLAQELKAHWENISKEINQASKAAKKTLKPKKKRKK